MPAGPDSQPILAAVAAARIVAVVTVETAADARSVARALLEGGIGALELTLRTPGALEAIAAVRDAEPALLVGAGTVLTPAQADEARACGAQFGLAPGFDAETVRHCQARDFPFIPGVATASEVQAAMNLGCRLLKFFPAEPLGGPGGLRALAAPFRYHGIRFLPLGGIGREQMGDYLSEPCVAAVGGSWIAPAVLVGKGDWGEIARQAAVAASLRGIPQEASR